MVGGGLVLLMVALTFKRLALSFRMRLENELSIGFARTKKRGERKKKLEHSD
jgi:hypothetical protein